MFCDSVVDGRISQTQILLQGRHFHPEYTVQILQFNLWKFNVIVIRRPEDQLFNFPVYFSIIFDSWPNPKDMSWKDAWQRRDFMVHELTFTIRTVQSGKTDVAQISVYRFTCHFTKRVHVEHYIAPKTTCAHLFNRRRFYKIDSRPLHCILTCNIFGVNREIDHPPFCTFCQFLLIRFQSSLI